MLKSVLKRTFQNSILIVSKINKSVILLLGLLCIASQGYGQLKMNVKVGPNHDGMDRVELCFSLTNTCQNDFDFNPADDQKVVIQFGHVPFEGDFTIVPDCLDPGQFQFVSDTLSRFVNESTISVEASDAKDFEMAFRIN